MTRALLLAVLLLLLPGAHARADTADAPAREAARLSASLMSPFCPGMTLSTCPSPDAATVRAEISDRLHRGEPSASIIADLEARFGDVLDGSPRARGTGWVAWLGPGALGLALLAALRSAAGSRAVAAAPATEPPLDPALLARLNDELDEL